MIPMFTLGVPGSGTTAVMLGALMIYGIQPGPLLFQHNPEIAWGVIASLFLASVICAIINIPLAGLLVRVLAVPPRVLYPLVVGMAFLGVYTINYSAAEFVLLTFLGLLGYFMKCYKIPTAPLILAVVVGSSMEQTFRQSLLLSDGNPAVFFRSIICNALWLLAALSIAWPFISDWRQKRKRSA
jgi:putative tricarboxylic transport membrane protein